MNPYVAVLLALMMATGVAVAMALMAAWLGPKKRNEVKNAPFECGNVSYGTEGKRYAIKYYLVAILFLVFDLEAVFIYPWAVIFRDLAWYALGIMLPFFTVLCLALAYEWRKGALNWE